MNERLEDLMYRAGLTAQGCWDSMDQYDREAIERFAELIVRECVECLKPLSRNHSMVGAAQDTIREHFGVEE